MVYKIEAKIKTNKISQAKQAIKEEAGAIILKHALGMATALYQVYPVGPESAHKDGSPHTRDTFAIVEGTGPSPADPTGGGVIASGGHFSTAYKKYILDSKAAKFSGKHLSFVARGAAFYLEWGTVFMEPRPLIRQFIKQARADIIKDLRLLNLKLSGK